MKQNKRTLRLSRETLTYLADQQLARAEGGIWPALDPNYTKVGLACPPEQ